MKREVLFLIRGLPQSNHISGQNVFMAAGGADFVKKFDQVAEFLPEFKLFFSQASADMLSVVGFRNDVEDETAAVRDARHRLDGVLDALCLITEELQPKVSSTFLIREGDSANALLKTYLAKGRLRWGQPGGEAGKSWADRNARVADYALALINGVSFAEWASLTDLGRQLAYSAKMFRHGIASGDPGIEYLCKFSALEGLVCGPQTANKVACLKARLYGLFGSSLPQIESDVQRLWDRRCEASHQALAFDQKLEEDLPLLEKLFLGAFVFAIDHVNTASTVSQLWKCNSKYKLPGFVLIDPPVGMIRTRFRDCVIEYKITANNIGHLFERAFQEGNAIG